MTDFELKVLLTVFCAAMIIIRAVVESERELDRSMKGLRSSQQRFTETMDKYIRDAFSEVGGNK